MSQAPRKSSAQRLFLARPVNAVVQTGLYLQDEGPPVPPSSTAGGFGPFTRPPRTQAWADKFPRSRATLGNEGCMSGTSAAPRPCSAATSQSPLSMYHQHHPPAIERRGAVGTPDVWPLLRPVLFHLESDLCGSKAPRASTGERPHLVWQRPLQPRRWWRRYPFFLPAANWIHLKLPEKIQAESRPTEIFYRPCFDSSWLYVPYSILMWELDGLRVISSFEFD